MSFEDDFENGFGENDRLVMSTKGEYDAESAEETARNISYYNAKELLRI